MAIPAIPILGKGVVAVLKWLFTTVLGQTILSAIGALVLAVSDALRNLLVEAVVFFIDIGLGLVSQIAQFDESLSLQSLVNTLPSGVQWVFAEMQIPFAVTMLITAITTKLALSFIPFFRN